MNSLAFKLKLLTYHSPLLHSVCTQKKITKYLSVEPMNCSLDQLSNENIIVQRNITINIHNY